ncbi:MAG: SSU ribosomal protein S2p (SAe) [uncultured Rubrobacteraceae bacterium]|uniref:Small ribosomal subunit protein uS2 n=1 Tax=uncultured Rubrobacteraceae bacterium TaxID=349277 RepID=A0A6J4SKB9_9ACTN|nr:MAG: SSU ribosomal protein S2p (SAe) [uncultured Rubrobacteraceae bacterium]
MRSGQPYVAERYIGGMLTNFQTILPRIQYFTDLAERVEQTAEEEKTGKDWFALNREYQKLRRNFAGLTEMERLPGAIFVVDPKREELMVKEANRLKIPVVALTDTNCDPEVVDYVIPGNDDAIRSIGLISRLVADAIVAGRGEEASPEDRPLPPAIEEAQANEEVEAAKAAANGSGSAEAPAETAEQQPAAPPAAAPEAAAEEATEPTTEPADDPVAERPAAEPADVVAADDPGAEEPTADVPGAEGNPDGPVVEEVAEEPADGQENTENEEG